MAPKAKATNVVTFVHKPGSDITHPGVSNAKLIQELNMTFRAYRIKMKTEDELSITIKSVQQHLFNDIDIILQTAAHAAKVKDLPRTWIQAISMILKIKEMHHEIIVNGIPTKFDPNIKDHREGLQICNSDLIEDMTFVRWLKPKALEDPNKRHSSILIGLISKEQVKQCITNKIWHGCGKYLTLRSGPLPQQCYNGQKPGHTAPLCPLDPLCPFCGDKHNFHTCAQKGKTEMKCTVCTRKKVNLEPTSNLKVFFASNPAETIHHLFIPSCPTRTAANLPP